MENICPIPYIILYILFIYFFHLGYAIKKRISELIINDLGKISDLLST